MNPPRVSAAENGLRVKIDEVYFYSESVLFSVEGVLNPVDLLATIGLVLDQ